MVDCAEPGSTFHVLPEHGPVPGRKRSPVPDSPHPTDNEPAMPSRSDRKGGAHRKHTPGGQVFMGVAVAATMAGIVLIVVGLFGVMPRTGPFASPSAATATVKVPATAALADGSSVSAATTTIATAESTASTAAVSRPDTPPVPFLGSASAAKATANYIKTWNQIDLSSYYGRVVKRGKKSTGMVALTFDDGPSRNTQEVLAALKAGGVRATFFFVGGRAKMRETAVRDTIAAGNEVGDHTWSHAELRKLSFRSFDMEAGRGQRLLRAISGYKPKLLRAQGGLIDGTDVAYAKRLGMVVVNWNVHVGDTNKEATVESIYQAASHAPAGSIVLLHETRDETVRALPRIIAKLKARGVKFVTVSELLAASR